MHRYYQHQNKKKQSSQPAEHNGTERGLQQNKKKKTLLNFHCNKYGNCLGAGEECAEGKEYSKWLSTGIWGMNTGISLPVRELSPTGEKQAVVTKGKQKVNDKKRAKLGIW